MRVFLSKLAALFRGRRNSLAQLDDELASHLEMLAEHYRRQGVNAAEARRMAHNRLGSSVSIREMHYERSGFLFLDKLIQDLRYGARVLRRDNWFTLGAVLTFGLGIGVATSVFTLMDALLLRPLPYRNPQELILMGRL